MVVFINIFNQRWSVLSVHQQQDCSGFDIKRQICEKEGVPEDEFFLTCNGIILENHSKLYIQNDSFVHCHVRVPGGKGGFGSMLRAIGAQIEKTTNREACRDLSGRRMRDVNDEKKIADWLSKQAERDQEKARRKQERLERLQTTPKHVFEDSTTYTNQLQENMDSIDDALQKGLKSSASGQCSSSVSKRKAEDKKVKKRHEKKRKLWVDIDEELSSDSEEESDTRSSCSSVTDSDFSVSETSSKVSSTVTTNVIPSGNTSEEDYNSSNPSSREENDRNSDPEILKNEKSPMNSGEIDEQPKFSTLSDRKILEQFVKPEKDQQETFITSKETSVNDSNASKLEVERIEQQESKLQNTEKRVATAESGDNTASTETEVGSNSSVGATVNIEGKCENTKKQNEDTSKRKCPVSIPLDLDQYHSSAELEALGLDVLKSALMSSGLKCGGTLQQRAERLFSIKGVSRDEIDPSLFAKPSGKNKEKRR